MWRVQYSTAQYSTVQLVAADKFGGVEKEKEKEKIAIWRPTLLSEGAWVKIYNNIQPRKCNTKSEKWIKHSL